MKTSFTKEQEIWLRERIPEYLGHVDNLLEGTGQGYADEQAEIFVGIWTELRDGKSPGIDVIKAKVLRWLKNSRTKVGGTKAAVPLLKIPEPRGPAANQLYIDSLEGFNNEYQRRRDGLPGKKNLVVLNELRAEKWGGLSSEEQKTWQERAEIARRELRGTAPIDIISKNRQALPTSLQTVLSSYSKQTGYSFFLLCAGPNPQDPDGPARVLTIQHCGLEDAPEFSSFHPKYEEGVKNVWTQYACHLEETRRQQESLTAFIDIDAEGLPTLKPLCAEWTPANIAEILTAYFNQLWCELFIL
ncbi:hypothetical protein M422DRAFT_275624 [Sphaerobolus stellatus SS14]|uniref:Uncharacterized protein n=1 Tax=Sphaerobolus stellatus (strain SS14) TaxID=990650 RepID=A0A0C9T4C5_SPHS4|nr:hypothetical protein M422DRAFT_275624 [Sphaerobolus stellatus SS14]